MIYALWAFVILIGSAVGLLVHFSRRSSQESMIEDADQLEQEMAFGIDRDMHETQRAAREVA